MATQEEWIERMREGSERVREMQAQQVDAHPNARPLTEEELTAWRAGEPMSEFSFIGIKDGVVFGQRSFEQQYEDEIADGSFWNRFALTEGD